MESNSLDLSLWVIFGQVLMQVVYFDALLASGAPIFFSPLQ